MEQIDTLDEKPGKSNVFDHTPLVLYGFPQENPIWFELNPNDTTMQQREPSAVHYTLAVDTIIQYCKTLNVSVPFISRISQAKLNRKIKGREYQLQAKIGWNYDSISNCMVLIRQNKGPK